MFLVSKYFDRNFVSLLNRRRKCGFFRLAKTRAQLTHRTENKFHTRMKNFWPAKDMTYNNKNLYLSINMTVRDKCPCMNYEYHKNFALYAFQNLEWISHNFWQVSKSYRVPFEVYHNPFCIYYSKFGEHNLWHSSNTTYIE